MIFSDEFIESLKSDPIRQTPKILETARNRLSPHFIQVDKDFEVLTEAYALTVELIETGLIPIKKQNYPSISGKSAASCKTMLDFLEIVTDICEREKAALQINSFRSRFKSALGNSFSYEFSQGDLNRIQELINDLRTQISNNNELEHDHKQRLLLRLERLQGELHKKVSDLDRFWGLIGDAGVVLGKLGKDAKPIVDRIREIADIVWQTQSRAEELPSGTQLPSLEDKQA